MSFKLSIGLKPIRSILRNNIGFVALSLGIAFLWSWLFLIDDAKLSSSVFTGYLSITLVFLTIVLLGVAIYWWIIKYLQADIKKTKNKSLTIAKIFFIWAFVELAVSWLTAVIWMGRNGSWSTSFPISSLTPLLIYTPLRFLTRFFGFCGLSSVVVTGLFVICSKKLRSLFPYYMLGVVVLTGLAHSVYTKQSGQMTKVTIVAEQLGSPQIINSKDSKLVVLPEYGLDPYSSSNVSNRFVNQDQVYFVGSKQTPTNHGNTNVLIFGSNKGFINEEQKTRLVPGGEYLPFVMEVPLRVFAKDTFTNFQVRRSVVKGDSRAQPFHINERIILGSTACSGVMSPGDYRNLVNQGATILTNSSSMEIFKGSRLFNIEHRGLAKFAAVANARSFVQSSNNWSAFALDQNGNQIAQVQPVTSTQVVIKTNTSKTLYSKYGEWVAYIGGIWLIIDLVLWRKTKRLKELSTVTDKTV